MIDRERLQVLALNLEALLGVIDREQSAVLAFNLGETLEQVRAALNQLPGNDVENLFMTLLKIREGNAQAADTDPKYPEQYAPRLFAADAMGNGVTQEQFESAMQSLIASNKINIEAYGKRAFLCIPKPPVSTTQPPQRGHKGSAANNRAYITPEFIKTLPKSEKEYDILDTEIPGFGVRVRRQAISFCVRKRLSSTGSPTRHTLGRFPLMTVEQARTEALAWLREAIGPEA